MIAQGYGRGCADREELFNGVSVQLLCDYVYYTFTQHMDEKKRNEFDAQLKDCGERSTDVDKHEMIERLMRDPMAEVELV